MANPLNLFPVRVPIGRVSAPGGVTLDVLMTPEFARALSDLLTRVGGTNNFGTDDILSMVGALGSSDASVGSLQQQVLDLQVQLASANMVVARVASLEQQIRDLGVMLSGSVPPVDWGNPGKIGRASPNTGNFLALQATSVVSTGTIQAAAGTVAAPSYRMTEAGTGFYRIGVDNWGFSVNGTKLLDLGTTVVGITGTLNNSGTFNLGNNLWRSNAGVTGLQMKGAATIANADAFFENTDASLILHGSSSGAVVKTIKLNATGSASTGAEVTTSGIKVAQFGCNGKTEQASFALGAAAVDLPTVITLANNIRTALINNGIGS